MSNDVPSGAPKNPLHEPPTVNTAALTNLVTRVKIAVFIVFAVVVTFGLAKQFDLPGWWAKRQEAAKEEALVKEKEVRDAESKLTQQRRADEEAKQELRDAVRKAERAEQTVQQCLTEIDAWEKETKAVLSNEAGRCLATDVALLREFQGAIDTPHTPRQDILPLLASVQELLTDWKDELSSAAQAVPSSKSLGRLSESVSEANKVLAEYQIANRELKALTDHARQTAKPGDITLDQALKDLRIQQHRERLTAKQKKLDEARAEVDRIEVEVESKKMLMQAAEKKIRDEDALRQQQLLAQKERLRRLAHSEEVKHYLGSLFEPGHDQPVSDYRLPAAIQQVRTVEKGPVSLSRIRNANWLADHPDAFILIHQFSMRQALSKDRPPLPIPDNPNLLNTKQATPDTLRFLKELQRLLRELGPTLVEEKLLAP